MVSKNIDQLAAASTLSDTDKVVVAQGGAVLKRGTLAQMRALLAPAMPEATIKGRAAGSGTGAPVDLTPAQARAILGLGYVTPEHYGAAGDYDPITKTGTDDTVAIMAAITAGNTLRVPVVISKRHRITAQNPGTVAGQDRDGFGLRSALFLHELDFVHIIGRGGELWFSGTSRSNYARILYAESCDTLIVEGELTFEWVDLPFVQGRVTAIDPGYVEFTAHRAITFPDVQRVNLWRDTDRTVVSTVRDRPPGNFDVGAAITLVSGTTYRISRAGATWDLTGVSVGSLISADHQIYGSEPIATFRTKYVKISGVSIRAGAGIAIWLRDGERAEVREVSVDVPQETPETQRLFSTMADAVHISGFDQRYIINNIAYRTGDDCINSHTTNTNIVARVNSTTLTCQYNFPFVLPDVGDRVLLINQATNASETRRVVSRTDPGIPPGFVGMFGNFTLVVDSPLPAPVGVGWDVVYIDDGEIDEILGNTVGYNRGRGILTSSSAPVVAGNTVRRSGMGVLVCNFATEFGATRAVIVQGNRFFECNLHTYVAAIQIGQFIATNVPIPEGVRPFRNVIVSDNVISQTNNLAILVENALEPVIVGNTMVDCALDPWSYRGLTAGGTIGLADCDVPYVGQNNNLSANGGLLTTVSTTNLRVGDNENITVPFLATYVGGSANSLRHVSVPGAVNFMQAQGNLTGFSPVLSAAGTDTNIALALAAKGLGSVLMQSNSRTAAEAYNASATCVNWVRIQGQISGFAVGVLAQGSDANIDLLLSGKGTGRLMFGTHTSNADAPTSGFIEVKDAGGTVRKLAVIS